VRVGPFLNRAEATATLRRLQAKGYRPFIAAERN
jgi:cell division protein FtsN